MILFPKAKINLGLNVTAKRSDGYHNIETVFYAIPWTDIMEIIPGEVHTSGIEVHLTGLPVAGKHGDNLCVKAYHLLKKKFSVPAIKLYLHKQIPMGAGLGGGSSDAASFVVGMNKLCSLGMSSQEMEMLVKELGADCAFFIGGKPVLAVGKGDEFTPINVSLNGYYLLVVHPRIHVSTADAYSNILPAKTAVHIANVIAQDINVWKDNLVNDFEKSVFQAHDEIATIKMKMYHQGAVYAAMSGSGSAVYGIFKEDPSGFDGYEEMIKWSSKLSEQ